MQTSKFTIISIPHYRQNVNKLKPISDYIVADNGNIILVSNIRTFVVIKTVPLEQKTDFIGSSLFVYLINCILSKNVIL